MRVITKSYGEKEKLYNEKLYITRSYKRERKGVRTIGLD